MTHIPYFICTVVTDYGRTHHIILFFFVGFKIDKFVAPIITVIRISHIQCHIVGIVIRISPKQLKAVKFFVIYKMTVRIIAYGFFIICKRRLCKFYLRIIYKIVCSDNLRIFVVVITTWIRCVRQPKSVTVPFLTHINQLWMICIVRIVTFNCTVGIYQIKFAY